ncbi:MAG: glycosyltransferase family 4 protein [candidate division Zixibacteria bacterium]|nr:glycosyltransferase family 4 protein [candidate division Zixibacteria bacterium]
MKKKIRLLHVIGSFLEGGTERLMLDILSRLDKNVFDITACSILDQVKPSMIEQYEKHGIKTRAFSQRSAILLIFALKKYINENCFDIIHTHHYISNLIGRIAAILAGSQNILTYNHNWPGMEKSRHRLIFKFLNLWTKKNIVVSETVRGYFTEVVGVHEDKVVTIHNGIDVNIFSPPAEDVRIGMKRELNIPANAFIVGFTGRLIDWKRPDVFIKAASLLAKDDPNMYFIVAGDGEKRNELEKLAKDLGLNGNISFLGWRSDMHRIYQAMDVFTVLSESGGNRFNDEGFSLVSAEAMATGLPLVAVDNAINREVIGSDAAVYCEIDPADIAYKIRLLSENKFLREELGKAGRKRAENCFNIKKTAEELASTYIEILRK